MSSRGMSLNHALMTYRGVQHDISYVMHVCHAEKRVYRWGYVEDEDEPEHEDVHQMVNISVDIVNWGLTQALRYRMTTTVISHGVVST